MEFNFNNQSSNSEPLDSADSQTPWTLFVDGSSTNERSGAGIILRSPEGFIVQQALRFEFKATNNEAEYEALLAGVRLAQALQVRSLHAFSDSQLVVRQYSGEYETREDRMAEYAERLKLETKTFGRFVLENVDRGANGQADALSRLATADSKELEGSVYLETLNQPSLTKNEVCPISPQINWMTPYLLYLSSGELPRDNLEAKKILYHAAKYVLIEGRLYKRSATAPLLKCLGPDEAKQVLKEVHEGVCGDHQGGKILALKILRQGYYWPTLNQDSLEHVRKCHQCQIHSNIPRMPPTRLTSLLSPIPFAMWGIDIVGPLPTAKGQVRFCIVAIDYMTKWAEAAPLRKIGEDEVKKFLWEDIILRFGVPKVIVADNGKQFVGRKINTFLAELGIEHRTSSVGHPQANGQVEVTNKSLFVGIKKRLNEAKDRWASELMMVLWAHRTTPRTATGETPFKLAYGSESLVPIEIGVPSPRIEGFDPLYNEDGLRANLDLADEMRDEAILRISAYQQKVAQFYDKRVRERIFRVGNLVLREVEASAPQSVGKLMPNWEGPYRVVDSPRIGSYKLQAMDGTIIKNTWHSTRLRRYFQ